MVGKRDVCVCREVEDVEEDSGEMSYVVCAFMWMRLNKRGEDSNGCDVERMTRLETVNYE